MVSLLFAYFLFIMNKIKCTFENTIILESHRNTDKKHTYGTPLPVVGVLSEKALSS